MRRFIITSTKFTGQVEFIYDASGRICVIDFRNAILNDVQINWLKSELPLYTDTLESTIKNAPSLTITEADFEVTFEMFWNKYNNKVNRKRTLALWEKLSKPKQVKAFYGIDAYNKYLSKKDWRNRQDPDTYLRNETFDNEWQ